MAGPLSGIGIQQPQITQTFQPAKNIESRQDQNTQRQQDAINDTEQGGPQIGRTNEVQQSREAQGESRQVAETRSSDEQAGSSASGRGSTINILV